MGQVGAHVRASDLVSVTPGQRRSHMINPGHTWSTQVTPGHARSNLVITGHTWSAQVTPTWSAQVMPVHLLLKHNQPPSLLYTSNHFEIGMIAWAIELLLNTAV